MRMFGGWAWSCSARRRIRHGKLPGGRGSAPDAPLSFVGGYSHKLCGIAIGLWLVAISAAAPGWDDRPEVGEMAVRGADRPRIAVAGFECAPDVDERDRWTSVALESLLDRGLRRAGSWVVVPVERLYQAQRDLANSGAAAASWPRVADLCGARVRVGGTVSVSGGVYAVALRFDRIGDSTGTECEIRGRAFLEVVEGAYRACTETLREILKTGEEAAPLETIARSGGAVEYYARALDAFRTDRIRDAAYYARQAIEYDALFRPAALLLAELELRGAPDARSTGRMRLNRVGELARAAGDVFDQIDVNLRQALICRVTGAFEAAEIRIEHALGAAYDLAEPYRQATAFGHYADLHLARISAGAPDGAENAVVQRQLRRAIEWQRLALDACRDLRERLGEIPLLHRIAMTHERLGMYAEALEYLESCAALTREIGMPRSQATTLLLMAQVHQRRQEWDKALDAAQQCLPLLNDASASAAHIAMASSLREMDRKDEALRAFERGYESLRQSDNLADQLLCLREIAVLRRELGAHAAALEALRDAIDLAHAMKAPIENTLQTMLGEWTAATPPRPSR